MDYWYLPKVKKRPRKNKNKKRSFFVAQYVDNPTGLVYVNTMHSASTKQRAVKMKIEKEENKTTLTTPSGSKLEIESYIMTTKDVYLDGHRDQTSCCEKVFTVRVNGENTYDSYVDAEGYPKEIQGKLAYGCVGGVYIHDKETMDIVIDIIKETESHPAWIARQAKIDKNRAEIRRMENKRNKNSYCAKCGSCCYGDCQ